MITFLVFAHVAVFLFSVLFDGRRGAQRLCNLSIPVGVAFSYTSVVQAWAAKSNPGFYLEKNDIQVALFVSLVSYLTFVVAYWASRSPRQTFLFSDARMNVGRLNLYGIFFYIAGLAGYFLSIRAVGGLRAYLRLEAWTSYLYETSGYIYMLKFAVYAAVALWLLSLALNGLPAWIHTLLVLTMFGLLFEAVQTTDRGDTIRASLPIVAWIYFATRRAGVARIYALWGNAVSLLILLLVAVAVLLFPEFRGSKRSMLTSEITLAEAIEQAREKEGSSRLSEEGGGEFDSAARIIKRVNAGEFNHPGPVHIARLFWNVIPRFLVRDKWERFNAWAGPDFQEVWVGSASYYGCTPTGWGEAYGCMGWWGALVYWALFGFVVRKYEGIFSQSKAGLLISVITFLPLMNYVVMTFFSASMTLCTVVVPVLVVLKLCQTRPLAPRRKAQPRPPAREIPAPPSPQSARIA